MGTGMGTGTLTINCALLKTMDYELCTKLPSQSLRDSSPKLRRAITTYKL